MLKMTFDVAGNTGTCKPAMVFVIVHASVWWCRQIEPSVTRVLTLILIPILNFVFIIFFIKI